MEGKESKFVLAVHLMTLQTRPTRWQRFRRNPLAMGGVFFIVLNVLIALSGPLIRPDDTPNANAQQLVLSRQKPGFVAVMLRTSDDECNQPFLDRWLNGRTCTMQELPVLELKRKEHIAVIVPVDDADTLRLSGKCIRAYDGWQTEVQNLAVRRYWLGTDKYGRDLLSRLMAGTSVSLAVGAVAVIISLIVGLTLGLLAGYYRGWVDAVVMWFTNVVWAVPTLLLVMAITFAFGTGFWKVFLAVGLTMWVEVARITRGQVLSVREKEFVEAARSLGLPDRRIILKHILPNILSPIIVIAAANFASAILIEAGLSFLGLGAQIPVPSWGNMIREHYAFLTTDLAYLAIVPGLMIMLLVLSFMMIGNGLRDALDVRR